MIVTMIVVIIYGERPIQKKKIGTNVCREERQYNQATLRTVINPVTPPNTGPAG